MRATEQQISEIKRELLRTKDHYRISNRLSIPVSVVREVDINVCGRFVQTEDRLGPPELRKYIVHVKHVDWPWPHNSPDLAEAKAKYDAGLIEICTGRDGFNLILYAFPRKEIDRERIPYFSRRFGDD